MFNKNNKRCKLKSKVIFKQNNKNNSFLPLFCSVCGSYCQLYCVSFLKGYARGRKAQELHQRRTMPLCDIYTFGYVNLVCVNRSYGILALWPSCFCFGTNSMVYLLEQHVEIFGPCLSQ